MKKFFFSIWGIFILFLIYRLFAYFNNPVPLGYDAGIYLYLFNIFPKLPVWQMIGFSPGLFALVFPFAKFVPPEALLIPVSILSQVFLFFSVYLVSKKLTSEKIALLTSFLFTVSLIQFRAFWFFYVKNTFALGLLFIALYFLTKKKVLPSAVFAVLLAFFHLPTFLIYFISLLVLMFWERHDFKFYLKVFILTLAGSAIYYLPTFNTTVLPFLAPLANSLLPLRLISGQEISGGTFYSLPISFLMTIFYLPFAFIGFYISRRNESLKPFLIAFVVLFLMVITGFFFSLRYLIPLDLLLIFFAGYGINYVFEKYKSYKDILPFFFIVLIFFIFAFVFKTSQPLISAKTLNEIKDFGKVKNGYILSTSKEDSAWLLGYTKLKLIAWSFGENDKYWNNNQWQDFYNNIPVEKKLNLLNKLPKPLYIFINDKQMLYLEDIATFPCVKKLTNHFYQYNCKKNR